MNKKYIDVDGIKTCYIEKGEGFPIVFVHGWLGSSIDFPALFPFLSKYFRVISLDLPGFGETPTFDEEPTITNYGKFVHRFVDTLSIGEHSIIGNCFGASVVIEYLLLSQRGVKKAVLLTPIFFSDVIKKKWIPIIHLFQNRYFVSVVSKWIKSDFVMTPLLKVFLRNRRRQYFLDAKAKKQQADLPNAAKAVGKLLKLEYRDRLKDIYIPVQVAVFQSDGYLNTNLVITTANLLPSVCFHIVRGQGHMSDPDHLIEDYKIILNFLKS